MTQRIKIVAVAQPKFITSGTVYVQVPGVGGGGSPATPSLGTIVWSTSGDPTDTTPSFTVPYSNLASTEIRAQYDAQADGFASPVELTPQTLSGTGSATFTTGAITAPFTGQFRASINNGATWTVMSGTFQVTEPSNLGLAPSVTLLTGGSNLPGFDIRFPVDVTPVAGWKIRLNPAPVIGSFAGAPFDVTLTADDIGLPDEFDQVPVVATWAGVGEWPAGVYATEISYLYPTLESAKATVAITVANATLQLGTTTAFKSNGSGTNATAFATINITNSSGGDQKYLAYVLTAGDPDNGGGTWAVNQLALTLSSGSVTPVSRDTETFGGGPRGISGVFDFTIPNGVTIASATVTIGVTAPTTTVPNYNMLIAFIPVANDATITSADLLANTSGSQTAMTQDISGWTIPADGAGVMMFETQFLQAGFTWPAGWTKIGDFFNGNGISCTVAVSTTAGAVTGTLTQQFQADTAWVASTVYTQNQRRSNGGNNYICTSISGTSAASGGPTGTGTGIVDGTVTWDYAPTGWNYFTRLIIRSA